jgi:hypothetical protein
LLRIADVSSGSRVEVLNLEYLNLKPATFFRIADVGSGARVEVLNLKPGNFYSG